MAHIQRRKNGAWLARYRAPNGRERSKAFRRKIDAENFLTTVEASKLRGEWVDPTFAKIPFEDWARRWLGVTVHLKPKTRAGYDSLLRTHIIPEFGSVPLGRIEPVDVRAWVARLNQSGLSASRIRQSYRVMSAAMRAAVETGYLVRSPCIGVTLPRPAKVEMRFLNAKEVTRLAEASGPYSTLVYLLAYGGIRWGEAAALRRKHCHLLRSRVEIAESLAEVNRQLYFGPTKTYQSRWVVVPAFLREQLAEHLSMRDTDPETLVFASKSGGPLRHSAFWRGVWEPATNRADLQGLRIHDLRHTCVALLVQLGAHPKAIQAHLGHSSITVTLDRYGHLFPENLERLADGLEATFHEAAADSVRTAPPLRIVEMPDR